MPEARIAPAARGDLRDIRIYSKSAFGATTARAYLLGLRDAFGVIGERPTAGINEPDLGADMRSFPYRSHRIYYRADTSGVLIVPVLHHARDVSRVVGGAT